LGKAAGDGRPERLCSGKWPEALLRDFGARDPLILLHGGLGCTGMFAPIVPALSRARQVIAVDLQAHGRTADIERPMSFQAMADDIAALMKQLSIERADLMGYSLGGVSHCAPQSSIIMLSRSWCRFRLPAGRTDATRGRRRYVTDECGSRRTDEAKPHLAAYPYCSEAR
jgi:alpha/beta hydrolase fold